MYSLIIVDDEKKILDGMVHLFPWNDIGFEVEASFTDAQKALEYLEKHEVNVVLSDIEMPGISGLELSRKLGAQKKTKIVLFSSYQKYEYFRSAIQLAVEDYILKPVSYSELLACFEKVKSKLDQENNVVQEIGEGYYEQIIAKVTEYLEQNYQNASLETAAEQVNLSPAYLSKIFKEKSGSNFSDILIGIRMKKAKEMLKDSRYKSYDIAYYLGYDNPKNFSRAFKNFYHMSPSEYRSSKISREENE